LASWLRNAFIPSLSSVGSSIINGLREGLINAWGGVLSWFEGVLGSSGTLITSLKESTAFASIGDSIIGGVKKGIEDGWQALWDYVNGKFNSSGDLFKAFNSGVDTIKGIGSDIINGIKSGLEGAWGDVESWVKDKLGSSGTLISDIKSALGISSPSKVFAEQIGIQIPAGIAMGIDNGSGAVQKALDNTVPTSLPSLSQEINFATAVAPVVDTGLSALQSSWGNTFSPILSDLQEFNNQTLTATNNLMSMVRVLTQVQSLTASMQAPVAPVSGGSSYNNVTNDNRQFIVNSSPQRSINDATELRNLLVMH